MLLSSVSGNVRETIVKLEGTATAPNRLIVAAGWKTISPARARAFENSLPVIGGTISLLALSTLARSITDLTCDFCANALGSSGQIISVEAELKVHTLLSPNSIKMELGTFTDYCADLLNNLCMSTSTVTWDLRIGNDASAFVHFPP